MASIVQSGSVAQTANQAGLTATFSTSGGTGALTAGNVLVAMFVGDDVVSAGTPPRAVGGGAAALAQRVIASAFCITYAYDLVASGGETGVIVTTNSVDGQVLFWWELAGVNTTVDKTGSATPASSADEAVGTVTPTGTDIILWCAGNDGASTYASTSVGTFDGGQSSTQTTGVKVSGGAGHIISASAQSPTVHNNTGPVSNGAGVIVAYQPSTVVAVAAPFLPLAVPPGLDSPMAFQFFPRRFPTINGWPSDSDRAGIGGLTAAPVAVRFVAVNWRSSASVATTVAGSRQAVAALPALGRVMNSPIRSPQPAAATTGFGRTIPAGVATRAANATAGGLARTTATLGKLLPLSAVANGLARAVSTVVRAPQMTTVVRARGAVTIVPLRAPQAATAAGALGRDVFTPVTIRQATSSAGGRATATAFTGRVFLLASNLRAVGSTVSSMLRSAQPAAAINGLGRVATVATVARQALAAVGALGRTTTGPRRTVTVFGSLAARGGVLGSLGRGIATAADVTAQGRIRALPVRAAQTATSLQGSGRLTASTTAVRVTATNARALGRVAADLRSGASVVNQMASAIRAAGRLDSNPVRVLVESTSDRSGVIFKNSVTGAHRTR